MDLLERRRLLRTGFPVLGAAVAGALVVRNQIRHPHKDKRARPDYKPRRLVLAAAGPHRDPVLLAAQDQGIFGRYNLDIGFTPSVSSGREALDAVQSGQADGAIAAALSWLPRLQGGLPARLVCGLQAGSSRLLVARHARLHRIEDVFHHAIGIAPSDQADRLFFSIMMRRKGMNPATDIDWRTMPREALGLALAEGQVQAIAGHDPAIWQLRLALHLDELASSRSGSYAVRVSRVLGLHDRLVQQDPNAALAITLAMQDAAIWAARHPDEVSVLLASRDPTMTRLQAGQMLQAEGSNVHPTGRDLRNQIAQYTDELKLVGLIPEDVDSTAFASSVTANVLRR